MGLPAVAHAQDSLGGHFGFVLPLVTRAGGNTIGELVVPIRFQANNNSVGIAVHIGVGF
jgi:hypothetical protein